MIYITQLIYIRTGQRRTLEKFEKAVLPLLERHSGKLLLRTAPGRQSVRYASIEVPHEIQLIRFESEQHFRDYIADEDRKRILALKQTSVRTQILIKGEPI